MENRKSLLVATDCSYHGTFNVAKMICMGLREDFDVALALPKDDDVAATLADLRHLGIRVIETEASFEQLERTAYDRTEATRIVEATRPDIVLCCDGAQLFSLIALKELVHERGVPLLTIINLLTDDAFEQFAGLGEKAREAVSHAAMLLFVSQAMCDRFSRLPRLADIRCRKLVIPNFCTDDFFEDGDPSARRRIRDELGIPQDALLGCTIGRIEKRKGQHLTLAALKRLMQDGSRPLYWIFAGRVEPWEREALEKRLDDARARDVVRVLGERADVRDLLDASDFLALTSYNEGMPLVVIEGLARGLPILGTAVDGVVEQIDDGCGVLLPPPGHDEGATIDALFLAIKGLVDDPSRLRTMRAGAYRRRDYFKSTRAIASYRAALLDVASEAASNTAPRRAKGSRDLAIGALFDLSDPAVAWNLLGNGWAACTPDGVQSQGARSDIRLRFSEAETTVRILFAVQSCDGQHSCETGIFIGTERIGTWKIGRRRRLESVTLDLARLGRDLRLQLVHDQTNAYGRALQLREIGIERPANSIVWRLVERLGFRRSIRRPR